MNVVLITVLFLQALSTNWAASCTYYGRDTICTLAATKDVWIDSNQGGNHHHIRELIVGRDRHSTGKRRFLIQFENIPSTCRRVKWANMYVYFSHAHKASWQSVHVAPYIPRELEVHQILKSWSETQVTATHRYRSVRWNHTDVGLDGTDAKAYSQGKGEIMFPGQPPRYVQLDVTDASRNWLSGESNYGLLVYATNEDIIGYDLRFHSREMSSKPFMTVACP